MSFKKHKTKQNRTKQKNIKEHLIKHSYSFPYKCIHTYKHMHAHIHAHSQRERDREGIYRVLIFFEYTDLFHSVCNHYVDMCNIYKIYSRCIQSLFTHGDNYCLIVYTSTVQYTAIRTKEGELKFLSGGEESDTDAADTSGLVLPVFQH